MARLLLLRQTAVRSGHRMRRSPGSQIPVKTLPAHRKAGTPGADVIELHLRLPASERLQFRRPVHRHPAQMAGSAASLVNALHDDALLQLHIRHVPGGLFH